MEIIFERVVLYEEVWQTPLTQLAKKYNLSDNGIRKVCIAMNIPLPVAGHWAKVAAGHRVPQPPLPANAERTQFVSHPLGPERHFRHETDEKWLHERTSFEQSPENLIVFDAQPKRWHRAVAPLRDALKEAAAELPKMKRDAERAEKNPRIRAEPNFEGWRWKGFMDGGQVLIDTHRTSPMRVTPLTYERALAILNTLCREAESRGFTVALDEKAGRIVFEGHGAKVEMRITERLEDAWRKELGWDKKIENKKYKVPTGALRLYVGETYHEREIADRDDKPLETMLNEVFIKIYGRVIRVREETRRHEAWKQQRAEEEKRQQEAEERRRELEAQRAAERRKREKLVADATAWQTANLVRAYLLHVETAPGAERSAASAEWLAWARTVADEMDPTATK